MMLLTRVKGFLLIASGLKLPYASPTCSIYLHKHSSTNTASLQYSMRSLKIEEKRPALEFIHKYFRDEPLNVALNLYDTNSRCEELDIIASAYFDDGVSTAAFDERGAFVGVLISEMFNKEESKEPCFAIKSSECRDPKFRRVLQVWEHLVEKAQMWDALSPSCQKVFVMNVGAVHPAWRHSGVMTELIKESERNAKQKGADASRMDCTSAYTAVLAAKLNYRKIYAVKYKDLPFAPQPQPPHVEASVFIKEI